MITIKKIIEPEEIQEEPEENREESEKKIKSAPKEPEIVMHISKSQQHIFRHQTQDKFYSKCRNFLETNFKDFTKNHDERSLNQFITSITTFGSTYDIRKEINIQKMMAIQIKYDFLEDETLSPELESILAYPDREEDKKVKYFHKQIIFMHG